jgi:hypothetical protein
MKHLFIHSAFVCLTISKSIYAQKKTDSTRFIGEYKIENNQLFKGTTIGGLSGIEKFSDDIYYFISDDFGEYGKPRMYKTKINYTEKGISTLTFLDVNYLTPPKGKRFLASSSEKLTDTNSLYCDAEAIRYDRKNKKFIWTSEGYSNKICAQPFIFYSDTNGVFTTEFHTDSIFSFDCAGKKGLQHNAVFEGLSFVPQTELLVYSTEKSLYQDIPLPTASSFPIRITFAEKYTGKTIAQYAYMLDNVFENSSNGITDILAVSKDTLLVLERAFDILKGGKIQLYRCTINNATNIQSFSQLKQTDYIPLKKELLIDFSAIGLAHIDNMEGMCWGHTINGKQTLLFVSDNNFNFFQITQVLLFEYVTR